MESPRRPLFVFPAILTAIFLVGVLIQISQHIMWRDELRWWQIARECTGPISLMNAMKFEGVPFLWTGIIFLLTRVTDNPLAMQMVHALIAAGVVYVVARWSPFSRLNKTLFAFGYFPFFEYSVITRNYSLVFLFMMIACVLISQPRVKILWLSGVLFLLSQVSLWGAGFAGLLFIAGIVKAYWVERDPAPKATHTVLGAAILLGGVILCMLQIFPGPGRSFVESWGDIPIPHRVIVTLSTMYRGLIPLSHWSVHFWNFNILDPHWVIQAILGVLLFASIIVLLMRWPVAMGLFLAGTTGLVALTGIYFPGSTRHHGQIFMLAIAAFWLAGTSPSWSRFFLMAERIRGPQLTVLLILNVIGGLGAALAGMDLPFSATRTTAQFIKANYDQRVILAGFPDFSAAPLAHWLDKPIYFPQVHRYARIHTQDDAVRSSPNFFNILSELYDLSRGDGNKQVLLMLSAGSAATVPINVGEQKFSLAQLQTGYSVEFVFNHKPTGREKTVTAKAIASFTNSVVKDEQQWLYLLEYKD